MTLPVPSAAHVKRIRSLMAEWQGKARRALIDARTADYRKAMGEVQACHAWLETYVDARADR